MGSEGSTRRPRVNDESTVELTEPGLYLDVMPANAAFFADAIVRRVAG